MGRRAVMHADLGKGQRGAVVMEDNTGGELREMGQPHALWQANMMGRTVMPGSTTTNPHERTRHVVRASRARHEHLAMKESREKSDTVVWVNIQAVRATRVDSSMCA